MSKPGISAGNRLYVWDPLVRIGHWLLVSCVGLAWLTRHGGGVWHELLGYTSLAVVVVRLIWGWFGSRYARFTDFLRGPRATVRYTRDLLRGSEARHIGHNPLGGWMVIALVMTVILVSFSGWLYTTDRFWGVEWVETLHYWLSNGLFLLVALHIAGVLYTSYRQRENLIAAMVHGRKHV